MNINQKNGTLSVTGLRELNATNAQAFHSALTRDLAYDLEAIEIDLSHTHDVDGVGLGALVALYETAKGHLKREGFALRLTNPTSTVQQMIELARLHHLYEITPPDNTSNQVDPPIDLK